MAHRATWSFGLRLFLPVNWKKNLFFCGAGQHICLINNTRGRAQRKKRMADVARAKAPIVPASLCCASTRHADQPVPSASAQNAPARHPRHFARAPHASHRIELGARSKGARGGGGDATARAGAQVRARWSPTNSVARAQRPRPLRTCGSHRGVSASASSSPRSRCQTMEKVYGLGGAPTRGSFSTSRPTARRSAAW